MTTANERFWVKVDKSPRQSGCWHWTAFRDSDGYGRFWLDGTMVSASRAAWILTKGDVPPGMEVLHRCDNPRCVNPDHLFLGTKTDNMADRDRKGRVARGDNHGRRLHPEAYEHLRGDGWYATHQNQASGENHGSAKLTWDDVHAIRREYLDSLGKVNQRMLGEKYGVDQTTVSEILLNKKWVEADGDVRSGVVEAKKERDEAILADYDAGMTRAQINEKYGVSKMVVEDAIRKRRESKK